MGRAVLLEDALRVAAGLRDSEQEVFRGDVLVLEPLRLVLRSLQRLPCPRRERERPALDARAPRQRRRQFRADPPGVAVESPKRGGGDAGLVFDQRGKQVLGVEDRALHVRGQPLRIHDRLLGLLRVPVEFHRLSAVLVP